LSRAEHVLWAAQIACQLEITALKPGNVTWDRPFSDVAAEQFLASSAAMGRSFSDLGRKRTGELILQAVMDTREVAGCNTNLGIALLLFPLAKAAIGGPTGELRERLAMELRLLTEKDTRDVYQAIRIASPGGLGGSDRYDVKEVPPSKPFLEAMAEARERDSVAREYVTDFEITFNTGLPAFDDSAKAGLSLRDAVTQTFLTILSRFPDTLIARKRGNEDASAVSVEASRVLGSGAAGSEKWRSSVLEFDSSLRDLANSFNPGTTADLTVAVLFCEVLKALEEGTLPEMLRKW
jgi:triphosphoribosyl-dephospho-CoA synthase